MAGLTTNFNVAPFYDDFDEANNYYRILFRPATAVQARELTQLQSILQTQIARFGNSIYKDGSIIEGCNFTSYPNINQVKFKDSNNITLDFTTITPSYQDIAVDANNTTFNSSNTFLLVSNTNGLRASVFRAFTGTELQVPNTNRAYVQYLNTGNNGATDFGQTSQQIDVYSSNQPKNGLLSADNKLGVVYTLTSNSTVNALGKGYGMRVGKGIIYQKGFFLRTLPSNFIIKEHDSNAAGIVIGFDTSEYIVTPYEDPALFDNSQGSPNYGAPGAFRLKLTPSPIFYDSSNTSVAVPNNFMTIVSFDQGTGQFITQQNTGLALSTLGDFMAQRISEINGDFIVKPFAINVVPHEANTSLMYYTASPGIAYVDGYRVQIRNQVRTLVPRGINGKSITGDSIILSMGNYFFLQEVVGALDVQNLETVTFYDTFQNAISLNPTITSPAGTALGKANIKAFKIYSGIKGTPSAVYQLFVFNIQLNPGVKPSSIKSVYGNSSIFGKFYADIVPDSLTGLSVLNEASLSAPLYNIGFTGVNSLKNFDGVNGTQFNYRTVLTGSLTPETVAGNRISKVTFTIPGPDEFPYGTGYLDDFTSQDLQIMFGQDSLSNTVINTAQILGDTGNTITSADDFTISLYPGATIAVTNTITNSVQYGTISSVNSSNSISLYTNITNAGNLRLQQFFKKGEAVNFYGSGNTIHQDSSTSITATIAFDPASPSYVMYGQIPQTRTAALPIKKKVLKNQLVKIDCGTNDGGLTGPWTLGISDAFNIANVYIGTSYSTDNPDQKNWFTLDTGQRDGYYSNARLSLKPQYKNALTSLSKLLVQVDCFYPNTSSTEAGFFSKDSYPIDDYNPSTNANAIATAQIPIYTDSSNLTYDLRNHIDIRPVMSNTAVYTSIVSLATENPILNTNTFFTSNNVTIDPDSKFSFNVNYFLPRIDLLVIDKNGKLIAKLGTVSNDPQPPALNNSGLSIAQIYVPPYPSLTFPEAQ